MPKIQQQAAAYEKEYENCQHHRMKFIIFLLCSCLVCSGASVKLPFTAEVRFSRSMSLDEASKIFLKMLGINGSDVQVDTSKIQIPKYMLDLYATAASQHSAGFGRMPVDNTIIRSFYNEGNLLVISVLYYF